MSDTTECSNDLLAEEVSPQCEDMVVKMGSVRKAHDRKRLTVDLSEEGEVKERGSRKKPKLEEKKVTWKCSACTFVNTKGVVCEICNNERPLGDRSKENTIECSFESFGDLNSNVIDIMNVPIVGSDNDQSSASHKEMTSVFYPQAKSKLPENYRNKKAMKTSKTAEGWACVMCTFINPENVVECEICQNSRPLNAELTPEEPGRPQRDDIRQLKILTWNIAMENSSHLAPASWNSTKQRAAIVDVISESEPDIIALQEISPSGTLADMLTKKLDFVETSTAKSHCGIVKLLVAKKNLRSRIENVTSIGPAVVVKLRASAERVVFVASMHLSPFRTNYLLRKSEIENVVSWCRAQAQKESTSLSSSSSPVLYCGLLCGDTNMRKVEENLIEKIAYDAAKRVTLHDAWKTVGMPRDSKFTWDSYANKFNAECFSFRCRFDRIYTFEERGILRPKEFDLVGNVPVANSGGRQYLSDHYGILATFDVS